MSLSFLILCGLPSSKLCAQRNEGFKVDVGIFGCLLGGNSKNGNVKFTGQKGFGFHLEPRYGINSNLTVGFRYGCDLLVGGSAKVNGEEQEGISLSIAGLNSYLATGEYSFSTNSFRPFAGLGLGIYSGETVGITIDGFDSEGGTSVSKTAFGVMPRVGFNFGHFRTALAYNLPFEATLSKYLSLTIGVEFGGGE